MQLRGNQIISIAQARELLGDEAIGLTDDEVQELIDIFDVIAQYSIQMVHEFKETEN